MSREYAPENWEDPAIVISHRQRRSGLVNDETDTHRAERQHKAGTRQKRTTLTLGRLTLGIQHESH